MNPENQSQPNINNQVVVTPVSNSGAGTQNQNMPSAIVQQKNNLAIAALVLSCCGVFIFITGIIGMILGIVALQRSKKMQNEGRAMSIAAIVIGFITGILLLLLLIVLLAIPALQKNAAAHP